MATLEHPKTGERKDIDGEIPHHAIYGVEEYDEENDELHREERVDMDGTSWIVVDDGVEMFETGSGDE